MKFARYDHHRKNLSESSTQPHLLCKLCAIFVTNLTFQVSELVLQSHQCWVVFRKTVAKVALPGEFQCLDVIQFRLMAEWRLSHELLVHVVDDLPERRLDRHSRTLVRCHLGAAKLGYTHG